MDVSQKYYFPNFSPKLAYYQHPSKIATCGSYRSGTEKQYFALENKISCRAYINAFV